MPFQKGNKLGAHRNHKSNFDPQQFAGTRWMQKDGKVVRVTRSESVSLLADGWSYGRPAPSVETRRKQSEAHERNPNRPTYWQVGHESWNRGGEMPEEARIAMSLGKLSRYGVTVEEIITARATGRAWCSAHLAFETTESFTILKNGVRATRCKLSHKKHFPWYKERFEQQSGLCAICGLPEPRMGAMCIDHNHGCQNREHTRKSEPMMGCECSRGLLCSRCNPRLGYFEGFLATAINPQFAEGSWEAKALAYLAQYA